MTTTAPILAGNADAKTRLRLWLRLLKATRNIENLVRENLRREFGSTLPRFDVMAALHQFPAGLKMSELSGFLKVSNGNVTGIVDRLVQDGLLLRNPVPGDRRALIVRLSKKGQKQFILQAMEHECWIDKQLGDIDTLEAEQVMACLDKINPTNVSKDKHK